MEPFVTALAFGLFFGIARIAARLIALASIAFLVWLTWQAVAGGVPAVEPFLRGLVAIAAAHRAIIAGAILGVVIARPVAALVGSSASPHRAASE
ncbi:MAG: hypothetical protein ACYC7F_13605 [Gemmatimonadaceae bacterium]